MRIFVKVESDNPGNAAMRAAFLQRGDEWLHGVEPLAELLHVKGSTAYKMCEELGDFASGTPSIAAYFFEVLRLRVRLDAEEGREVSLAEELALESLLWVRRLRGRRAEGDFARTVKFIVSYASDVNFASDGRQLSDMSVTELRDLRERVMRATSAAEEGLAMIDGAIAARTAGYTGAPITAERAARAG